MPTMFNGDNFKVEVFNRQVRGNAEEFEVVRRPRIALAIPKTEAGRFVLVRQQRAAIDCSIIEFPAGRLEPGESPKDCVRRELAEECGFIATEIQGIGSLHTAPHFSDELLAVFNVKGKIMNLPKPTSKESINEVLEVTPVQIQQMIVNGEITDAKTLAAFALTVTNGLFAKGDS